MRLKKHGYVAVILLMGCFISFPFLVQPARGETRYVSDILIVSLRDGPGNEYSVVRTVKTDMALEVIEEEGSFVKVHTETGEEGWVSKQYLTVNTPKSMLISNLNKEIATLKKEIEKLEGEHDSLKSRLDSGSKDHATELKILQDEITKYKDDANATAKKLLDMTKKYDTLAQDAGNVLTVTGERDRLQTENEALKESTQNLKKNMEELGGENQRLMRNEILHWFLAGSGVFFLGLLTGKLSRKKKHY